MKTDTQKTKKLLQEFPIPTAEEWRAAAEQLLKGAPFEKVMQSDTPEGIRLEPIFRKEVLEDLPGSQTQPGFDGYLRGTQAAGYSQSPWVYCHHIDMARQLVASRLQPLGLRLWIS